MLFSGVFSFFLVVGKIMCVCFFFLMDLGVFRINDRFDNLYVGGKER